MKYRNRLFSTLSMKNFVAIVIVISLLLPMGGAANNAESRLSQKNKKEILLVLDDKNEKPQLMHVAYVFSYEGTIPGRWTKTGFIEDERVSFGSGKIECKEVDGEFVGYEFAVFADKNCPYEEKDNNCRLIHGRVDVSEKKTHFRVIDDAVVRTNGTSGVVAKYWESDPIDGKLKLRAIWPEKIDFMFMCNSKGNGSSKVHLDKEQLVQLIAESPRNVRNARIERNRQETLEKEELAKQKAAAEEEDAEWEKLFLNISNVLVTVLVAVLSILAIALFIWWSFFKGGLAWLSEKFRPKLADEVKRVSQEAEEYRRQASDSEKWAKLEYEKRVYAEKEKEKAEQEIKEAREQLKKQSVDLTHVPTNEAEARRNFGLNANTPLVRARIDALFEEFRFDRHPDRNSNSPESHKMMSALMAAKEILDSCAID